MSNTLFMPLIILEYNNFPEISNIFISKYPSIVDTIFKISSTGLGNMIMGTPQHSKLIDKLIQN